MLKYGYDYSRGPLGVRCGPAPIYSTLPGWLREYMAHDCAKRTYAYCTAPHMCPTDGPMARGARGDIPGNSLGQGFTSTST